MRSQWWLALALALFGCRQVSVKDALRDMSDARYVRSVEAGRHRIELRYLPKTLRILKASNLESSRLLTGKVRDSLVAYRASGEGIMFVLRLDPKDSAAGPGFESDVLYGQLSGFGSYPETLREYQFGLREKIWLEAGGRKFPLANYQMENTFGMDRGRVFLLLFPELPEAMMGAKVEVVLDDIVPGLARRKFDWILPVGKHDEAI